MFLKIDEYGIDRYLDEHSRGQAVSDRDLDFVEQQILEMMRMLRESRDYVRHLKTYPPEQRPGGSDYDLSANNAQHSDSKRKQRRF